jgi:hypothetical protein
MATGVDGCAGAATVWVTIRVVGTAGTLTVNVDGSSAVIWRLTGSTGGETAGLADDVAVAVAGFFTTYTPGKEAYFAARSAGGSGSFCSLTT